MATAEDAEDAEGPRNLRTSHGTRATSHGTATAEDAEDAEGNPGS
jgi:hypothetical protein